MRKYEPLWRFEMCGSKSKFKLFSIFYLGFHLAYVQSLLTLFQLHLCLKRLN